MRCKIVFQDNSWIIGRRVKWWETIFLPETTGTHHWIVEDWSEGNQYIIGRTDGRTLIGMRVAIPIDSMKYMVFL
jgi:hypothetical protein